MKNKGFTIMELIAVIVLIGLLAILASIPINKILKDAKNQLNESQIEQIKLAAENWATDAKNQHLLPPYTENKFETTITIEDLFNGGYFEGTEIVNMINNKKIKTCSYVKIKLNTNDPSSLKNVYSFEFVKLNECLTGE